MRILSAPAYAFDEAPEMQMNGETTQSAMAMWPGDYRDSHLESDAAQRYGETYEAGYYAALWTKVERPLVATLLRATGSLSETCLDFACGSGRIASLAAEHFGEVVGVDVSAAMLARARCPDNVRLHQIDITRQSLGQAFDVVTAFRFFLNAEPLLREEALEAIRQHLNRDGRLVCNIQMNATSPVGIASRIVNRLPWSSRRNTMGIREMCGLLRSAGYDIERVVTYGYMPRPGNLLPRFCEVCVEPVERLAATLRIPAGLAQQFIVVARRR